MKSFNFEEHGINSETIKDFDKLYKEYKKSLKATIEEKSTGVSKEEQKEINISNCNKRIEEKKIVKGTKVVFLTRGKEIFGTIANTPRKSIKSIKIAFNGKETNVTKDRFVRIDGEVIENTKKPVETAPENVKFSKKNEEVITFNSDGEYEGTGE